MDTQIYNRTPSSAIPLPRDELTIIGEYLFDPELENLNKILQLALPLGKREGDPKLLCLAARRIDIKSNKTSPLYNARLDGKIIFRTLINDHSISSHQAIARSITGLSIVVFAYLASINENNRIAELSRDSKALNMCEILNDRPPYFTLEECRHMVCNDRIHSFRDTGEIIYGEILMTGGAYGAIEAIDSLFQLIIGHSIRKGHSVTDRTFNILTMATADVIFSLILKNLNHDNLEPSNYYLEFFLGFAVNASATIFIAGPLINLLGDAIGKTLSFRYKAASLAAAGVVATTFLKEKINALSIKKN